MALIHIKSGAYGYRPDGRHLITVTRRSGPVEVSDDEAARLVGLGIADYVTDTKEPREDEEPEYNTNMKAAELQAIMSANGVEYKNGMTKADMVAALDACFDGADDSGDEPPVFEPEVPTV